MIVGVMTGYRLVFDDQLGYAFACFWALFMIMDGIIIDLWMVSTEFYLEQITSLPSEIP